MRSSCHAVTEQECANIAILANSVRYAALLGDKPTNELTTSEFVKEALKVTPAISNMRACSRHASSLYW
jgi:hypothetical protein